MIDVQRYRVQLRASIGGLSADEVGAWAFGRLDGLMGDPSVIEADVAATLGAGLVDFDLQVRADAAHDAMRLGAEAVDRAAAAAVRGAGRPEIDHAEVDRIAIPA